MFTPINGSDHYRAELGPYVPEDGFTEAEANLGYLFKFESSAIWSFALGPEEAQRILQPVLIVAGENTEPIWIENNQFLQELIPDSQKHIVPGANHFSQVLNPEDTARALTSFLEANPIKEPATAVD